MSKTNVEVVRGFIDQILNARHLDQVLQYTSKDCWLHSPPYIGLGTWVFPTPDNRLVIQKVAKNAPATGKVQAGDELVRVSDIRRTWDTFEKLKNNPWEIGKVGETVTITVRRSGKLMDIPLVRSRIEGDDITIEEWLQIIGDNFLKNWPVYKIEIKMIVAQGDLVTVYIIIEGTNSQFHADAVWSGFSMARVKDGKMVDWWSVDDGVGCLAQLGYQQIAPQVEAA